MRLGETTLEKAGEDADGIRRQNFKTKQNNKRAIFVPTRLSVCMQTLVTKLGIVVHYYEPECHATKMGFCLQGQGHSVGLSNQNMTVSTISFISSKPVSLLQPDSI